MTFENFVQLVRMLAVAGAIACWVASSVFNYKGFNITIHDMAWVGIVMSLVITIIQLVWNKVYSSESGGIQPGKNFTFFIMGIVSYIYGITTNIAGILAAQGTTFMETFNTNVFGLFLVCIVGFFMEYVPESLIVWGLTGVMEGGDLLGNLFQNRNQPKPNQQPQQPQNQQQNQGHQQQKPGNNNGRGNPQTHNGPRPEPTYQPRENRGRFNP